MSTSNDRLPLWWLIKSSDIPRREIVPLLRSLDLPIEMDAETGDIYTSRVEFARLLWSVAGSR